MGRRKLHNTHLPRGMTLECGTYYFRGRGDRKRVNLGQDEAAAIREWVKIVAPVSRVRTLHDIIAKYRLEVLPAKRSPKTRDDHGRMLSTLDRVFGENTPAELTAQDCYQYLDGRRDKHGRPAPVAARHEISLLGHVITKGIRWGAPGANVVRTLERMPKAKRTRYVTDDELAACRELANERLQLAIDLARNVGQRRGDLLSLRWAQVTKEGVEFRQGKTGAGVLVEITPDLQRTLDALKALSPDIPRDYVLRMDDGQPFTAAGFSTAWQRLMTKYTDPKGKTKGLRFTFHDLRAKAASDKGTIEEAQALLGHSSSETTKRVYKRNLTKARPVK